MIFVPAAPKTRGIKAEEDFSQDFVQIDLKKLRNNVSCHLSEKRTTSLFGSDSATARKQFNTSVDLKSTTLQILGTLVGFVQTLLTPEKLQLMAYGEHLPETAS